MTIDLFTPQPSFFHANGLDVFVDIPIRPYLHRRLVDSGRRYQAAMLRRHIGGEDQPLAALNEAVIDTTYP